VLIFVQHAAANLVGWSLLRQDDMNDISKNLDRCWAKFVDMSSDYKNTSINWCLCNV